MSRVIKFRAWNEEENHMIDAAELARSMCSLTLPDGSKRMTPMITFAMTVPQAGFTLEQFTGLVDKTGREIYEGDILRLDYRFNVEQYDAAGTFLGWSKEEYDNYYLYEVVYSTSTFSVNGYEYSVLMNGFGTKRIFNSDKSSSANTSSYGEIMPLGSPFDPENETGSFGHVASHLTLVGNIHEHPHLLNPVIL